MTVFRVRGDREVLTAYMLGNLAAVYRRLTRRRMWYYVSVRYRDGTVKSFGDVVSVRRRGGVLVVRWNGGRCVSAVPLDGVMDVTESAHSLRALREKRVVDGL